MEVKQVSSEEVKSMFVLAHAFKEKLREHTGIYNNDLKEKELLEIYGQFQEEFKQIDIDDFILERDPIRFQRYENMNWYRENKEFNRMGVWPKMQSIDIELTRDSAIETSKGIQKVLEGKSNLVVPERFVRKSNSIRKHADFIFQRFTPILFPGGEVRENDYNNWARENGEPLCNILDYDIDDGNSRIVSYALDGVENMPVYVAQLK